MVSGDGTYCIFFFPRQKKRTRTLLLRYGAIGGRERPAAIPFLESSLPELIELLGVLAELEAGVVKEQEL